MIKIFSRQPPNTNHSKKKPQKSVKTFGVDSRNQKYSFFGISLRLLLRVWAILALLLGILLSVLALL